MGAMIRLLTLLLLVAAAQFQAWGDDAVGAPVPAPAQAAEPKFSEAETRMWMTDQLRHVTRATDLHYEFHKTGSFEAGFDDKVELKIQKINADGSKNGILQFFSGERSFPVPPLESTTVNPVLKIYMQGDVYEMNRLTDASGEARERWRYFQRGIKFALAEGATVKPTRFDFDGRSWQGHEISFAPYAKDPKRNLFEKFADKQYSVIVSDDLPGYLFKIETTVPGEQPDAPLIHEVLQLASVKPAS